ncbi:sigma-70 family RNA polymerase sigma factor [Sporosarcina sp. Sa2YVA2]|uniref:Sigma-70 family RNA polymerase sigma factor n=1 Tax=Sporosarcina quadrami TaxID=2762234 RepID=A0ABR8UC61_9BACL|nr:sigma-70 family RNA polymerase sigma factor [Sporosarcina quadrami]MBD7985622.1 sigma-70 family RNA polymerase sigma factor [Sporosarcina quadrami]
MNEADLISKAQTGDRAAFAQLMELHYRTVEKFAYQCGVRIDDIPDVTQEVFIKLYRFLPQFNQQRFTTWLYKITLNAARDYYRKASRENAKEDRLKNETGEDNHQSAEKQVLLFEEDQELHTAILQLEEKYRIPLILFYFQDLTYQQISEVMNITMAAVKTRIFRAKDILKKEIESNGGVTHEQ